MKRMDIFEKLERRRAKYRGHFGNSVVWAPRVLRIEPEWARQIYVREKTWEFRKKALPLSDNVYLFETAPVNAITGSVNIDVTVSSDADAILACVKRLSDRHFDCPGKRMAAFLKGYAKPFQPVVAHHVHTRRMFERPIAAGVEDERGVFLDVPANPFDTPTFSFRDKESFFRLLDELHGTPNHRFWEDPAEAVERYDRIRNAKEAGNA